MNNDYTDRLWEQSEEIKGNSILSIRPVIANSCLFPYADSLGQINISSGNHGWLVCKMWYDHFYEADSGTFHLTFDPLVDFRYGRAEQNNPTWVNTRGAWLRVREGKAFSFDSYVMEDQGLFPDYLNQYIKQSKVVPGQGYARKFGTKSFDYGYSGGVFSYTPASWLTLNGGYDKQFIGNGYRSLFLSDNAYNYPFFRIDIRKGPFYFSHSYCLFLDNIQERINSYFARKPAAFNVLGLNFFGDGEIYLFESSLWPYVSEKKGNSLNAAYYLPLPFTGLNNGNINRFAGTGFQTPRFISVQLYGQILWNATSWFTNKGVKTSGWSAYQVGLKSSLKYSFGSFIFQTEWNRAKPDIYGANGTLSAYTNDNQPLAHPMGNNFNELFFRLAYQYRRFGIEGRCIQALQGTDSLAIRNVVLKQDKLGLMKIFSSNPNQETHFSDVIVRPSWLLNPKTNLKVFVEIDIRKTYTTGQSLQTQWISIGLASMLFNHYYDF